MLNPTEKLLLSLLIRHNWLIDYIRDKIKLEDLEEGDFKDMLFAFLINTNGDIFKKKDIEYLVDNCICCLKTGKYLTLKKILLEKIKVAQVKDDIEELEKLILEFKDTFKK